MSTLLNAQVEALGWALLHSLWQGALLWMILEAALAWPGSRSPRTRGRLAGGALLLFVLAVAGTYGWVGRNDGPVAERRARMVERAPAVIVAGPAVDAGATAGVVAEARGQTPAGAEGGDGAPPSKTEGWRERVRPVLPWLVGAWGAGVAFGLGRHAREWRLLRRLRRGPRAELSPEWRERFAALCARCAPGMRLPRVGETALVRVPQVIGGWAPVILLPAGFLAGLPTAQTEAVLAHELAHLVRRDFWLNVLQSLAEAVFFFHPAVHAMNAHIRRERERACDDLAVAWTGDSLGYARALATLAGAVATSPTTASCVLAADGHEPGELRSRIGRLLGRPVAGRVNWAPGGWLVVGALAAYAALFAASPVIVAQVLSPEERVKVVREAMEETRPRQRLSGGARFYPEGKIKILSELRTEDGSPAPEQVWGMFSTSNGDTGSGGSFGWTRGRAAETETIGVVSLMALPEDGWAPAAVFDVKPIAGAAEVAVPPMTLRKGRPLRVRLSDSAGKALAGAKVGVRVWPRGADFLNYFYRKSWVSDEAGMIVLPNADPAFAYQVTADLPGRQGTRRVIENVSFDQTVAWVMPAAQAIRGQVVDKANGSAVAGAKIWLALVSGVEGLYAQNLDEPALATTDAEGRFELPGWDEGGLYALRFVHPTHATALVRVRPGETLRVELEPGGHRVSGRLKVLTEKARGSMRDPRMSVVAWISTGSSAFAPSLAECKMTPEGGDVYRFEFERLPSGQVDFSVRGASSRGARLLLSGDREDVALTMDDRWLVFDEESPEGRAMKAAERAQMPPEATGPKRTVEIRVKASDGGAVPAFGFSHLATPADLPKDANSPSYASARVESGKTRLADLPVGAKVVLMAFGRAPQGYWIPSAEFTVPEGEGIHRHEIQAYPAGVAVVEVLEANGVARIYDRVGLEGHDPLVAGNKAGRFSIEDSNTGDKNSRTTINGVPLGGRYRVVAQAGTRVARSEWFTLDAAQPRANAQVRFAEGRPATARVSSIDGKPLAGLSVMLGYQSDFVEYVPVWSDKVDTNASGEAGFPLVTVDDSVRYRLRVAPRRDWQPQAKTVSSTRPDDWVFALRPGLKARGRVVDGAGRPVAGAQVTAFVDDGGDPGKAAAVPEMSAEEATDAEGRFRFSNLVPARLVFRVDHRQPGEGGGFPRRQPTGDEDQELLIVVR